MNPVRVGDHLIGPGQPCLIIAEAGVNHNGDVTRAHQLIDAAAAAGADAVKFQSFVTEELTTREAPKADYQVQMTGWHGGQYAMLKALELDVAAHAELKAHCERVGLLYLCTPYDATSVERLERLGVTAFKIASTDTTNLPLLPASASSEAEARKSLAQTLSGLHTALQGVCELRNAYGFASHGSDGPRPVMEGVQALLAAQAADAIVAEFKTRYPNWTGNAGAAARVAYSEAR